MSASRDASARSGSQSAIAVSLHGFAGTPSLNAAAGIPHPVGADIGGIDIAHRVSRNTGRRSAGSHGAEVGRIARGIARRRAGGGPFVIDIADPQIALIVDRESVQSFNQSL